MSYGDNTPMTSSDEDDDHQVQHGNFTETHLDERGQPNYSSNRVIDDDEDDDMNDVQNDNMWIEILYEGDLERFPIRSSYETLQDLRDRIKNNMTDRMKMTECHYFIINDPDQNEEEQEEEEDLIRSGRLLHDEKESLIKYKGERLSIYWKSFDLTILDGMDLNINLRVSQDWTISKIKQELERKHNVKIPCLSHNGDELQDINDLGYYQIRKSGFTLVSRISISIEDHSCEIATDILICDFWDFEAVLTTYLEAERRERHRNAYFMYMGKPISLKEQVYNRQLRNRSKLEYKVDEYPINIYDSESAMNAAANNNDLNAVQLFVWDQWTLNDVKRAYSKLTKKPFMEKEKFLSQERELEDNVALWKLRMRDNEKLIIEREQQEISVEYICCECGSRVILRRFDSVQCRQCFHGAVYKQRTARVCQYSCR